MDNKGFTLIELIATLTIIILIMALAFPNMNATIENHKRSQYINDAKNMIKKGSYVVSELPYYQKPKSGRCVTIMLRDLSVERIPTGPNGGRYNPERSYIKITYASGKYVYEVQLLESFNETRGGLVYGGIVLTSGKKLYEAKASKKLIKYSRSLSPFPLPTGCIMYEEKS